MEHYLSCRLLTHTTCINIRVTSGDRSKLRALPERKSYGVTTPGFSNGHGTKIGKIDNIDYYLSTLKNIAKEQLR